MCEHFLNLFFKIIGLPTLINHNLKNYLMYLIKNNKINNVSIIN